MNVDIVLPDTAWEGVEAGVQALVDRWLVEDGAAIEAGQPLVRVVLVKSTIEVDAVVSGRLDAILVHAGENFARHQPLGRIAVG